MNNPVYYRTFRIFAIFAMLGLAGILNSCGTTSTYSTPTWASGISDGTTPYYYFPNYDMYYDASAGQYYYLNNGSWMSSGVIPYQGVELNNAYVVELNRGTQRPWMDNDFYRRNYPAHEGQEYSRIAREQNLIPNVPQNRMIVPRAYDENTQRMIFEERRAAEAQAAQRGMQPGMRPAPGMRPGMRPGPGPRVMHQVPMRSIAPNMPAQARQYRYGGDNKGR